MSNILNFLKYVLTKNKENSFVFLGAVVLSTLPLNHAFSSISFGIFVAFSVFCFNRKSLSFPFGLWVLISFFLLVVLSSFWTIDTRSTSKMIWTLAPFVAVPIGFFILKNQIRKENYDKIFRYFSFAMVFYGVFFLLKAVFRYVKTGNKDVFFYHELATSNLSAIYASIFMAFAFLYFLLNSKKVYEYILGGFLLTILFLFSSKNIILTTIFISAIWFFFFSQWNKKVKMISLFGIVVIILISSGTIFQRLKHEYDININNVNTNELGVRNLTIQDVLTNSAFSENDYFSGVSFRVFQFRIYNEIASENNSYVLGLGSGAVQDKINEKLEQYHLHESYIGLSFHNQYLQTLSELGIPGLLLILISLFIILKTGIQTKDFLHIAFALLMISLFATESFLGRQRGIIFFVMLYSLFYSRSLISRESNQ